MVSRNHPMSVKNISNYDGFEKFIRKMCSFKGGWENMRSLLENAYVLQRYLSESSLSWEPDGLKKVQSTKSGRYLLDMLNMGTSEINEVSVQLDYVREYLADFGVYGFRLLCTNKIEDLS